MRIPTNPMYDIDENAVVRLISTGSIIPEYINRNGRRAVKIRGKSHKPASHPLDRLMLITYKTLPSDKDPEWLSVKFVDGNKNNLSLINVLWSEEWFHPTKIPGISIAIDEWVPAYGYPEIELSLSDKGIKVRDALTLGEIGYRLNKDGYHLIKSPLHLESLRLHRVVALTFLAHPIDTDHLSVNHKDSNKENNTPFNLEWATYSQNNSHAYSEGPRSDTVRKIRVKDLIEKDEKVFSGINDLARYLKVLPGTIHSVMERRTFEGRPYKGYVFKYEDDPRSWEELANSGPRSFKIKPEKIACLDIKSKTVKIHLTMASLENEENIPSHTVFRLLRSKHPIPFRGKIIQAYSDDKKLVWPEYPDEILRVYDELHSSDKPLAIMDSMGNVEYCSSVTKWCEADRDNRCDPAVLSRYMKRSKEKCRWRDWVFEFVDLGKFCSRVNV